MIGPRTANDLRRSQQAHNLSVHLIHFRLFQNVCHTFVGQSKWGSEKEESCIPFSLLQSQFPLFGAVVFMAAGSCLFR